MKHLKLSVILLGIVLLFSGCGTVKPEAPNPISPDDVWEGNLSFHTFIWESVEEANNYALQIAADEDFANTVFIDSTIQDTTFKVFADNFVTDTLYYWRVAAGNEVGWSEWSTTARFYRGGEEMLISPEDGEVFFRELPIFLWHSYPTAENYVIRVCLESFDVTNTVWEDTTDDTTYQIPEDYFLLNINNTGTITWAILMLDESKNFMWTSPRTFIPAVVSDHYYPILLGYEWTYEGRYIQFDYENDDSTIVKENTYTITFSVAERKKEYNRWYYSLEGDYPRFRDQSSSIPVWEDSTEIYMDKSATVYVYHPNTFYKSWEYTHGKDYFFIRYRDDTLHAEYKKVRDNTDNEIEWTDRVKGIGVISQGYERYWRSGYGGGYHIIYTEELAQFTTPDGQVWPPTD